jgi:hypothetical protein
MSTAVEADKWPAHPVADLFPRMTDEELADLAADIKANGLIHPKARGSSPPNSTVVGLFSMLVHCCPVR